MNRPGDGSGRNQARDLALRWWCVTTLALLSCSGSGGSGGNGPTQDKPLRIEGRVLLPGPVEAAQVTVAHLEDDNWIKVATGTTDKNGSFLVKSEALLPGELVLVEAGGDQAEYREAATGSLVRFGPGQTLAALAKLPQDGSAAVLFLDPWTTVAACVAHAYYTYRSSIPLADPTYPGVAALASRLVGEHLARPLAPALPTAETEDPTTGSLPWPSMQALLGITVGGLSQQAADLAAAARQPVTTIDLVAAICADGSDGILEGTVAGPDTAPDEVQPVILAGRHLSSNTTRFDLAAAIHAFVLSPRNASGITPDVLGTAGGLYEDLSLDTGPLYPDTTAGVVKLFDPFPPALVFSADTPDEDALICGKTTVQAIATDSVGIKLVAMKADAAAGIPKSEVAPAATKGTATVDLDPTVEQYQGKITVTAAATDTSGNEAEITRTFRGDGRKPDLPQVEPSLDACLVPPPTVLVVTATDGNQNAASLTLTIDGVPAPCAPQEDGTWKCDVALSHGDKVTVTAKDACGNSIEDVHTACLDGQDPVITANPPDGSWYGPATSSVTVTLTDDVGPVTASLFIDDVLVPQPDKTEDGYMVSLPPGPDIADHTLRVDAHDDAGHFVSGKFLYHFDPFPPVVTFEQPLLPSFSSLEEMVFLVQAADEAGVAAVDAACPEGTWWTESMPDGAWKVVGHADAPPATASFDVALTATDLAGNASEPLVVQVRIDQQPPLIQLKDYSFRDEMDIPSTYDPVSGNVAYDQAAAPEVHLSAQTCAASCPPFTKLASRLSFAAGEDLLANNLPAFKLLVSDDCPPQPGYGSEVAVSYWFYHGDAPLAGGSIPSLFPCQGDVALVPVATQLYAGSAPGLTSFAPDNIPDRLVVSAVDWAGNVQSVELLFQMTVTAPPLFPVAMTPLEENQDLASTYALPAAPKLEALVASGAALDRARYANPHDVPIQVTLTLPAQEKVTFQHQQVYLASPLFEAPGCAAAQCRYSQDGVTFDDCAAPVTFALQDLLVSDAATTTLRVATVDGIQIDMLSAGDSAIVPPHTDAYFEVFPAYAQAGLSLPAPVQVSIDQAGTHPAYLLGDETAAAVCGLGGVPPKNSYFLTPDILSLYISHEAAGTNVLLSLAPMDGEAQTGLTFTPAWACIYVPPFQVMSKP